MPLEMMICRLCARSRPDFLRTVRQLAANHPGELLVVELECMAACDDVPAMMLETDYYPQVSAQEVIRLVQRQLQMSEAV